MLRSLRARRRTSAAVPVLGGAAPGTPPLVAADGSVVDLDGELPSCVRGRLLVFLPFASSPVCTREVGELRDRSDELATAGLDVVAVTCDAVPALAAWTRAEQLTFPVLSDFWPHGAVARAWGVLEEATGAPRRVSFLVDAGGSVVWRGEANPGGARSLDDVLDAAGALLPSRP